MRILLCNEIWSQHSARWFNQFKGSNWEFIVFQPVLNEPGMDKLFTHGHIVAPYLFPVPQGVYLDSTLGKTKELAPEEPEAYRLHLNFLIDLIKDFKPDLIHSNGLNVNFRNMLSPLAEVQDILGGFDAPWLYSTWGSDLTLFPSMSDQNDSSVRNILAKVDAMTCEVERDRKIAIDMGFKGNFMGLMPVFGGLPIENLYSKFSPEPSWKRKAIFLKGRDHLGPHADPVGRAMTVLLAMERIVNQLEGYEIYIAQATPYVIEKAKKMQEKGLNVTLLPHLPYDEVLEYLAHSRIFVAMTVNDGLPSSLCEALSLGVFPVHSRLDSVADWIMDGENGLLADPEDVTSVANVLLRALQDDELLKKAHKKNTALSRERLDERVLRKNAYELYEKVSS